MPYIELGEKRLEYKLKRSNRKTVGIKITIEGELIVVAPLYVSVVQIENLLKSKESWILSKINLSVIKKESLKAKSLLKGDKIYYRGEEFRVNIKEEKEKYNIFLEGSAHLLFVSSIEKNDLKEEELKEIITAWYIKEAKEVFKERTEYFSYNMGVKINSIHIKNQKTLWGSCSYVNNINYNWRVIMAPKEILDYLVVHELAHVIHKNHSKEYWELVGKYVSNYKEKRKWLKEKGHELYL